MSEARVKLPWSRGAWLFWVLVLIQLGLCVIMYRLSNMRARRLFLTTYYDPFYSELYLSARTAPSASNPSAIPPYPSWYEIPAMVVRGGWEAALQDVWGGVRCAVWLGRCGQAAREVWNNAGPGLGQARWPPV
ncbi:hypothetical protein DAEQUDRAFT_729443 [Daedalea quercina L-15889]|uniref:Uncharacterized protein n=1 Tax=Daedalea quercina L-15889 TaxID=1314783 RepID=A0A165NP63_9APHY|nr:hypothetical protein DAEQUDRAFT_729443 [Daedalea quercina L-15889]